MPGKKTNNIHRLVDRFGREHTYLRMSVTDQCNFSCSYCNPLNQKCNANTSLLSHQEIGHITREFVKLGIKKIRLTGGEPLVRKDFNLIAEAIGTLNVEKAITTNGMLLNRYFSILKSNGFKTINISLDTLNSLKFKEITGSASFDRVFTNIMAAIKRGFRVKLNTVIMKGVNETEIVDFAQLTLKFPIDVRFIEFMPFADNNWNTEKLFAHKQILNILQSNFLLHKLTHDNINGPAHHYQIKNAKSKLGLISSVTNPFCNSCNRIRVTSDGKIKSCLFGVNEIDLKEAINNGLDISQLVLFSLSKKSLQHGGSKNLSSNSGYHINTRNMYAIGG